MRWLIGSAALFAGLLAWTGTGNAQPQLQQDYCDSALYRAWGAFSTCVGKAIGNFETRAKEPQAPLIKCRHKYFAEWDAFQLDPKLAGSTCVGPRFVDNGDQTVSDNLTGLVWEKKDNSGGLHDKDNIYQWSSGDPYKPDGDLYTTFIAGLNSAGFAGAYSWRMPNFTELLTIVLDFPCKGAYLSPTCTCPVSPCIDATFDSANTAPINYWTGSPWVTGPRLAWIVGFGAGEAGGGGVGGQGTGISPTSPARAVRDGLWR